MYDKFCLIFHGKCGSVSVFLAQVTVMYRLCCLVMCGVYLLDTASYKVVCTKNDPIVTVRQGQLQGSLDKLYDGSPFYSFKGVPYARPPVGQLRFRAPLPPQPWHGIRNATNHSDVCAQNNVGFKGSEDCLFLNIYSKSLQPSSKIPVMVFIYGGGYLAGSGNDDFYGPKFLLQHDVVLVTFNYRLEVLGFLCLDTPEVPGNAGMKDQVAAMRWVKNNIAKFGGDPDNITLFGESAGASSVVYHMLSPMSQGLFHKAITQSGTSINDWALGKDGKERAFRVAKYLGKDTNDTTELLEFLRGLPAANLTNLTIQSTTPDENYRGLPVHFAPYKEKRFKNVEAFLSEDPMDIILSKRMCSVPLMLGYNSAESITMVPDRLKNLDFYNKNPSYDVPREIVDEITQEKTNEMGERIRRFYVGDREFKNKDVKEIVDLLSDMYFVYNTHRLAYLYSKYNSPIYMYRFSLVSDLNKAKHFFGFDVKGACHSDELFYIFSADITKNDYESQDELKNYVWKMTKLWTDFAKTSNPTPPSSCLGVSWPRYSAANKGFLDIDAALTPGRGAERERVDFWNKLYCEAGLPCISKSNL